MECIETRKIRYPLCPKCGERLSRSNNSGNSPLLRCPECGTPFLIYVKYYEKYVEVWFSTMVERKIPNGDDISDAVR